MKTLLITTKDFLKKLPKAPGVYLFKNKNKEIIYVGRAALLRTRVSSYFNYGHRKSIILRPIEALIGEVALISYIKTSNLLEAVVLENNLIKKYFPKYNVKDKDNRSFVYLFFDAKNDFPKPVIVRGRELERRALKKGKVLGPYQSQRVLKNILLVARKVFPYSTCKPLDSARGKPCFHYQIGLCPGVCVGKISSKGYKKNIRALIKFLKSKRPKINKKIDDIVLMPRLPAGGAENSEFSTSGFTRIDGLALSRIEGYDISHFQKGETYGAMVVFENGRAKNSEYRLFKIREAKRSDDACALKEVLLRRLRYKEWKYPDLIVVDGGRQQVSAVSDILKAGLERSRKIPVLGISKSGRHSQSSAGMDTLVFSAKLKKSVKEILSSQKKLFQQVRNEAHRFSIKALRKSQRL